MVLAEFLRTYSLRSLVWSLLMAAVVGLLAASGAAQTPAKAGANVPENDDIERWISELSDDNYSVRQAAADRLMNGGAAARTAISRLVNTPDPEVRAAARRLVTLIDETEFSQRLAKFASDVDGRLGATMPGWKEFSALLGSDRGARNLFVEMQREESPLLERVFGESGRGGDSALREIAWDDEIARRTNWQIINPQAGQMARLGTSATLIFLGAIPSTNMSDTAASSLVRLTQIPPIGETLLDKRPENVARRLVIAWIVNCPNRSEQLLQQRLELLMQFQLAEALPLALEVVRRDPKFLTLHPAQRVLAVLAVGKYGSVKDVAALETLLEDRAEYLPEPVVNGPQSYQHGVQVRDVALATLLHLTGQEPITYGLSTVRTHPQALFDATSLGMESDERRDAAAEQWRAWRADHKL